MKINPIGHLVKTNPIQTQSKPVLSAVEWANFFKGQNELKIACQKIWPHPGSRSIGAALLTNLQILTIV